MDESDDYDQGLKPEKRDALREEVLRDKNVLLEIIKMLERSEARIDRTNTMIEKLVDACKSIETAYTSHVASLQSSRDISQRNNVRLFAANERMMRMMETARADSAKERERFDNLIDDLEESMKSLKEGLHKSTDKYWRLQEDYRRLAECLTGSRNYTIGCNNAGDVNSKTNL